MTFALFTQQFRREWLIQKRQIPSLLNSCLFFLVLLGVFPLTLKPEVSLMRMVAPGFVWMSLLLSLLLSAERLFQNDYDEGVVQQWLVSGQPLTLILGAKLLSHWLFTLMPIIALCPVVALLFSLSTYEMGVLVLSLLCGTPALFFLCALAAVFSVGINQKGALVGLILLPLTLPLLVFGSATLSIAMQGLPVSSYIALLCAFSLIAVGFLPFAISLVVRISLVD